MAARIKPLDLINAAKAVGWTFHLGNFPGAYRLDNSVERPTPDYVTSSMWPGGTYLDLRQVTFLVHDDKLSAVWTREGTPWVGARESRVSAPKALAYIQAHPREVASAETTGAPHDTH